MPKQLPFQFYLDPLDGGTGEVPDVAVPIMVGSFYTQLFPLFGYPFDRYEVGEGSLDLGEVMKRSDLGDITVFGLYVAASAQLGFDIARAMELHVWVDLGCPLAMHIVIPSVPVEQVTIAHAKDAPRANRLIEQQLANRRAGIGHHVAELPRVMVGPQLELLTLAD